MIRFYGSRVSLDFPHHSGPRKREPVEPGMVWDVVGMVVRVGVGVGGGVGVGNEWLSLSWHRAWWKSFASE